MRARKNKKSMFLRKSTWLLIVIFIATLITIPSFTTKTEAAEREIINDTYFKILNIDPGAGEFTLGTGTSRTFNVPSKTISVEGQNRNIQITRISMAEFISMTDEIRGQYDAVVVGRKNTTGLSMYFSTDKKYRDYSPPFYQQYSDNLGNLFYTDADGVAPDNRHPSGYVYPFGVDKGKTFIEYCSENDITKKRADELTAMISSNELVYFDNDIFKDELKTSKIYTIFNPQANKKTFAHSATSDSIIEQIKTDYTNLAANNKRPVVDKFTISADDYGVDTPLESARNMNIVVTLNGTYTANDISAKLYLDNNADTRYVEKNEGIRNLDYTVTNTGSKTLVTIKNTISRYFIGYLDWKVEIIKKDGAKTYVTNHSIYKGLNNYKKKLNVLQIHPRSTVEAINKGSLYLSPGGLYGSAQEKFNTTLTDSNLLSLGYELTVHTYPVNNVYNKNGTLNTNGFNESIENGSLKLEDFDMIIVGFADSYSNNQFTLKATNAIQGFVESGKSALFTHDTITLNTFGGNHTDNTEWNMNCGPKLLGQKLRDYLGQARYVDNYRDGIVKDINKIDDIYHDELIPNGSNGALSGTNTAGIKYSVIKTSDNADTNLSNNKLFSMGATLYMNAWDLTKTKEIRSMNSSQITSYPYDLNTNANGVSRVDGVSTFGVSETHTQWFQLNLEDPEVVPLYNLSKSNFDSGDSRNYYYTYSRANLTYSGTGHTSTDYANQPNELKLFVNTIIKAARGGNNPPEIINKTTDKVEIANGSTVSPEIQRSADYDFITIPSDLDIDDGMKVTVTANGVEVYKDDNYIKYNSIPDVSLAIKIPKSLYQDTSVKTINVVTTVQDEKLASSSKSFNLNISDNVAPTITNKYLNKTEISNGTTIPDKVLKTSDYEFITIPNDGNDAKVDVTMTADGQPIYEVDNNGNDVTTTSKTSNQEIKVRIPKSVYGNKSQVTVTTTVKDPKGATDTKTFILKINQPPTIINKYLDTGVVIDDGATVSPEVKRTDSYYDFSSIPNDSDDGQVTVSIKANGEDVNEVNTDGTLGSIIDGSTKTCNEPIKVRIPSTAYKYVNGDEITVTTTVTDALGETETKTFKLKIVANDPPTITNYYFDNYESDKEEIVDGDITRTKVDNKADYYEFVTVPRDTEDEDVSVTIKADGQDVYEDGVPTVPIIDSLRKKDLPIKVIIPKTVYEGKSQITVTTSVKDQMGATQTKSFILKINQPPTINNFDLNNASISSDINAVPINVYRNHDFDYLSIPLDIDDTNVKVTIKANGSDVQEILESGMIGSGIVDSERNTGATIKVRIPKSIYQDIAVNEVNVVADIVDSMGLAGETKIFKLKIVNDGPTIVNKYNDGAAEIQNLSTIAPEIVRNEDYDFISIPSDNNGDKLFVTMEVFKGNDNTNLDDKLDYKLKEVISDPDNIVDINDNSEKASGNSIKVRIPKAVYEDVTIDFITVKTSVRDEWGATDTKTFNIKIRNEAPTLTNMKMDDTVIEEANEIKVPRTDDYNFKSMAVDPEGSNLTLTAKLFKDETLKEDIDTRSDILSGNSVNFTISNTILSEYLPGDKLRVEVTAVDDKGAKVTKSFFVIIDQIDPVVTHSIVEVTDVTNPTYFKDTTDVLYFKDHDFIGEISSLFDNTATVTLTIDPGLRLKSQIKIFEMTKDSEGRYVKSENPVATIEAIPLINSYSYTLNKTLNVPNEGIKLIVEYKAEIYNLPTKTEQSYTNLLKVGNNRGEVTINSKRPDASPDLF